MSQHLLSTLLGLPLLAAFIVLFTPRQMVGFIRAFTVFAMVVTFALSLGLLKADYSTAAMQFVERHSLVPAYGITYKLGIDGMSLWLILLTTFIVPLATYASWTHIETKVKEYAVSLLVLETAMLGAFFALDLFLFYVFWELMLVPMMLIIGIWGGVQRVYAAVKFFLFTMVGSMLMLVAILYADWQYKQVTGQYSFELSDLNTLLLPVRAQVWCFAAFALAFAIKVPMFPFHTWLPLAHVEAPTAGSVLLAAVLLKMGTYGFLRFALPLFPNAAMALTPLICLLAVIGIVYGALVAMVQPDLKKLVAYSSVSHLGFCMLGMFALNPEGWSGSILQMINHGISTGALFLLVGVVYERRHTRLISEFGGLWKVIPVFSVVFLVVMLSSIALPGTNGFVGEFLVLLGAFKTQRIWAILAATGVILSACYMLWMFQRVIFGSVTNNANEDLKDLTRREVLVFAPLLLLIFWLGVYPQPILSRIQPSVNETLDHVQRKAVATRTWEAREAMVHQGIQPCCPDQAQVAPGAVR
jgi:NADH-quinone oxidoreductase subunit M